MKSKLKIEEVKIWPLRYPLSKPIFDARLGYNVRESLLVEIITNKGISGVGEAGVFGGALPVVAQAVKTLSELIIGEDPLQVERIWQKCYQTSWQWGQRGVFLMALSGIDIALWDIVGQIADLPLFKIFGACRDKLVAYASGGFYSEHKTIADLEAEVASSVERGFRAVKIKVGRQPSSFLPAHEICRTSLEEDIKRVRAVRQVIGREVLLMLDANNAWTPKAAVQAIAEFSPYQPYFIEEPVFPEDIRGSAYVRATTQVPIAGYETLSHHGRYGYRELMEREAVDIIQFDVSWCGGLTEARKIAQLAQIYDLICIPHCFSSGVTLVATMHLLCSIENSSLIEYDINPNPLRDEISDFSFELSKDGTLAVPKRPGLGIKLNRETIRRFAL